MGLRHGYNAKKAQFYLRPKADDFKIDIEKNQVKRGGVDYHG
jgi:hypothetical protein